MLLNPYIYKETRESGNISIKNNARDGFLRCALSWEIEKRIRELFTSYDEYREAITELFINNYFSEKPADNIKLEVPSFQARTGVSFSVIIPRDKFIHYSVIEWTTNFSEKTVPIDTPLLAKIKGFSDGEYAVVKCVKASENKFIWQLPSGYNIAKDSIEGFKACE